MKKKFKKLALEYIKIFEKKTGLQFDGWVGDLAGEIATLGDYFFDFNHIRYFIDNETPANYIFGWYDFVLEFQKCYIKPDAYCKLRSDFECKKVFGFNEKDFIIHLIYMRIK